MVQLDSLSVIRTFMADATKINRICGRFLQVLFVGALCLIGGLVGFFLVICGPYGWAIALIWFPGWFYGVAWIIVKVKQRNEFYDRDA